MGAPQFKPTAEAGAEDGRTVTQTRALPFIAMVQRPGSDWLVSQLPPDWQVGFDGDLPKLPPEVLIRWGEIAGPDGSRLTLNSRERLLAVQQPEWVRDVWAAARVRALPDGAGRWQVRRRFRVDLFNGRVLATHLRASSGRLRPMAWNSSKEGRLVAWHAMRAMHALRLDFGAVWIGVHRFRTYALSADAAPPLTRTLARHYAQAFGELEGGGAWWPGDRSLSQQKVVLGADPEFVLRDHATGRMLPASDYFPRFGRVGCDRQLFDRAAKSLALVEVRPEPDEDPVRLVEHIRSALEKASRMTPNRNIEWVAGSRPFPRFGIGGHIHFSGVPLSRHLIAALDNYLAVPMMLVERAVTAKLRRHRYGYLGDVRVKEHGGFEYRTLSSWLISPSLARSVLALAKVVATDYQYLRHDWLADPQWQAAFHACQKEAFYDLMPEVWRELEATPSYARYQQDLTLLRSMIEKRQRWNEHVNMRETWRL